MKVAVVGLGKLGLPMAALFAHRGHEVTGLEMDQARVTAVNAREDPLGEPGLAEMLAGLPAGALAATRDPARMAAAEVIFVVVPTPSDEAGSFSAEYVMAAIDQVGAHLRDDRWRTVVVSSTVMPGTMSDVARRRAPSAGRRVGVDIGLAYSPEFIALGSVLADMSVPDFVLVGSEDTRSTEDVAAVLLPVTGGGGVLLQTNFVNAEMAKLAVNAFVTMKISYANTVAEICEALQGARARTVLDIIGHDRRIGRHYLSPGGPFGGPCFPRDTVAFARLARRCGVPPELADATRRVNDAVVRRLARHLSRYRAVAILGVAYKPLTPVTDASLGSLVAHRLMIGRTTVVYHDPVAQLEAGPRLWRASEPQVAVDAAEAVLVAQPLPEYADLDYGTKPVIDVWGLLAPRPGIHEVGTG